MTTESVPTLFRAASAEDAATAAKAWARSEHLRVRTIASIRARGDGTWLVTLVLDLPDTGRLPDPPTLWGEA